jgi:hypothetical protein
MDEQDSIIIEKVKQLLKDREGRNCQGTISYGEIGKELGMRSEDVQRVIGRRFIQMTPITPMALYKALFKGVDPDFYLLGDGITEISKNKEYQMYKRRFFKTQNKMERGLSKGLDIGSRLP